MQKHSIVWVRKSRSRDSKGKGLRQCLGHTSTFSTTFTKWRKCSVARTSGEKQPAWQAQTSPFHGLCSLGISLARKERPKWEDPEVCGDFRDHLLDSTKALLPHLWQESVITFHSTSASWVQFNFAPVSDCRFCQCPELPSICWSPSSPPMPPLFVPSTQPSCP